MSRPAVTGHTTSVYDISVGAAWSDVALATLDDITIGAYPVGSTDVIAYLSVENTHATQTLRVRWKAAGAAGANDGVLVPALSFRSFSLYGQNAVLLSFYGSGAATTGVATMTWSRP